MGALGTTRCFAQPQESAVLMTLQPGAYTAIVSEVMEIFLWALRKASCLALAAAALGALANPVRVAPVAVDVSTDAYPGALAWMGDYLLFVASSAAAGPELWRTDGSAAGTVLVRDARPGVAGSAPMNFQRIGATLYFTADDGANGRELWKSDGTTAGTVMVKDINPGAASSSPEWLTAVGSTLFFFAIDGTSGAELWKSDGTAAGTVLVKDINPGSASSGAGGVNLNGTFMFVANDGINGLELWKSDGTAAGTVMVKDINPGPNPSNPSRFAVSNGLLYFEASDFVYGFELWKSDGTAAGTTLVKDIFPGSLGSQVLGLTDVGGTLFFTAQADFNVGHELWKSDGTPAGTVLVKDVKPGPTGAGSTSLVDVGGTLYFCAYIDNAKGFELWKSDGTPGGTVSVKSFLPGPVVGSLGLYNFGGTLYFIVDDRATGLELWKSDGTSAGTVQVADLRPGALGSFPRNLTVAGNRLYFVAHDGVNPLSLWYYSLDPARLANISTRGRVQTGDDVMIAGLIVGGPTPKTVVARARGPSLAQFGVTGLLANPQLQLYSGSTVIASNDNWQQAVNAAAIQSAGFAPSDANEAAIMMTLAPGAYTAIVTGVGGTMGVAIIEVFEVDAIDTPLINISTRARVLTGDDVLIAGFIIHGDAPQPVAIRARGPSLAQFNVGGLLANPVLQVFSGQTLIASNDNWQQSPDVVEIQASVYPPSDPSESVIFLTLAPGAYTAIVTGAGATTGVGIVEVFRR